MSLVSGLQGLAVPLSGHAPGCADSRVLRFAVDTLGRVAHIRNHILRNLLKRGVALRLLELLKQPVGVNRP